MEFRRLIVSSRVSKIPENQTKQAASVASKVLRDSKSTKKAKSLAASALTQRKEVKKGGAAYVIRSDKHERSLVANTASVQSVNEGTEKYDKALRRLAKK